MLAGFCHHKSSGMHKKVHSISSWHFGFLPLACNHHQGQHQPRAKNIFNPNVQIMIEASAAADNGQLWAGLFIKSHCFKKGFDHGKAYKTKIYRS